MEWECISSKIYAKALGYNKVNETDSLDRVGLNYDVSRELERQRDHDLSGDEQMRELGHDSEIYDNDDDGIRSIINTTIRTWHTHHFFYREKCKQCTHRHDSNGEHEHVESNRNLPSGWMQFDLPRRWDTFNLIYIEIYPEDLQKLLEGKLAISLGKQIIQISAILTCYIMQLCRDRCVKGDQTLQIPVFDFDCTKLPTGRSDVGHFQNLSIMLYCNINCRRVNILVGSEFSFESSRKCLSHTNIFFQDSIFVYPWREYGGKPITLWNSHPTKFIMIYFSGDKDSCHPYLDGVTLTLHGRPPTGKIRVLDFTAGDIITLEVFDNMIYILPLASEFSDLRRMCAALNDPKRELTEEVINFSAVDKAILELHTLPDLRCDTENVNVVCVTVNFLQYVEGNYGLMFCN